MKKSSFDFSTPQRQSYVAILMIIWKSYKVVLRQLFPVLIILFVGNSSKSNSSNYILMFIISVALLSMLYGIVAFFRYYYYIDNDKIIVEKGVFGRSKTIIPFEKIQTINFEQNIAHQIFSVVKLKIDTAGSSQKEFNFDAINIEKANALREIILNKKSQLDTNINPAIEGTDAVEEYKSILHLSVFDLIKVGITENHFRSGGLILLALWWLWDNLSEAGLDLEQYADDIDLFVYSFFVFVAFIVFFVILSFVFSLLRTVLTYYDLRFWRSSKGFKVSSGLLTKKDVSALDQKIQMISWSDNLLRKIVGYYELQLKQASSVKINKNTSIKIPGCKQYQIDSVTNSLYGKDAFENIHLESVDLHFMYRRMFFLCLIGIPLILLGYFEDNLFLIGFGSVLDVYFIVTSYFRYKKIKFGHNTKMLLIKGGLFGDKVETFPIIKLQNVKLTQSPYQRRKHLANVKVYTAAGSVTIPYVDHSRAIRLTDYILYKTEKSNTPWM